MLRIRFYTSSADPRPVKWPVKHPYWITGESGNSKIIVSYADDIQYIFEHWPEAEDLQVFVVQTYVFTERFPKPEWFK